MWVCGIWWVDQIFGGGGHQSGQLRMETTMRTIGKWMNGVPCFQLNAVFVGCSRNGKDGDFKSTKFRIVLLLLVKFKRWYSVNETLALVREYQRLPARQDHHETHLGLFHFLISS